MLSKKQFNLPCRMLLTWFLVVNFFDAALARAVPEKIKFWKTYLNPEVEMLAKNQNFEPSSTDLASNDQRSAIEQKVSKQTSQAHSAASNTNQQRQSNRQGRAPSNQQSGQQAASQQTSSRQAASQQASTESRPSEQQAPQPASQREGSDQKSKQSLENSNQQTSIDQASQIQAVKIIEALALVAAENNQNLAAKSNQVTSPKSAQIAAANEKVESETEEFQSCPYFMAPGSGHMMMGKGAMPGMAGMGMCPMYSDKVELNISEIENGIIIKWTSSDPEVRKQIKLMGERMKMMHSRVQENKSNSNKK